MEEFMRMIASIEFASPLYFWLGGAVILLLIFLPAFRKPRRLRFDLGYWRKKVKLGSKKTWTIPVLIVITSLLIATALANPQIVEKRSIPFYGKPVIVLMDVSGSMGSMANKEDSPFVMAREVFYDIAKQDMGAAIGLSIYSSENYIARDFTTKIELLKGPLENEKEISEFSFGTMTEAALRETREFFSKEIEAKDKSIILISDLVDNLDNVSLEIRETMEAGINVYVVTVEKEPKDAYSRIQELKSLVVDSQVKIVWSGDEEGILQICEEIRQMESSLTGEAEILSRKSLAPFLLSLILGLTILCIVLSETVFRKIP